MKGILMVLLFTSTIHAFAQGCADAGFCSVGAMHTTVGISKEEKNYNTLGLSIATGLAEKFALVVSPQLEMKLYTHQKNYVELKAPFHIISGNLGENYGLGDLMATYTFSMFKKNDKWQYTTGFRVGLGDASDEKNNKPLPMTYQTSLGTTDIILGASFKLDKHWTFATGIQQPVLQYNNNGYYTTDDHDSVSTAYFSSRKLRRSGDVLLRADYKKDWKHMGFRAGPIILYHLANDRATDTNGNSITLANSSGFTINVNFGFYYQAPKWIFDFTLAGPVHARDNRPDGLTRNAVVIPRFTIKL